MMALSVLVLEDHPFQRTATVSAVKRLGVSDVLAAADGTEALDLVRSQDTPLDIVICDLQMDGMDGVEFIRRVGDDGLAKAVIVASGLDEGVVNAVEHLGNAQGLWVLGRLPKPLRLDALRDLLQTYQREAGGRVEHRFDVVEQRPLEEIVDALNSRAFEPFFQPRVSLARNNVVGAEALARWNHPELGLIPPAAFIPAIEHAGHGDTLTDIMLDKSLEYAKRWLDDGLDIAVSVNFPAALMQDLDLPGRIDAKLEAHGLPAPGLSSR